MTESIKRRGFDMQNHLRTNEVAQHAERAENQKQLSARLCTEAYSDVASHKLLMDSNRQNPTGASAELLASTKFELVDSQNGGAVKAKSEASVDMAAVVRAVQRDGSIDSAVSSQLHSVLGAERAETTMSAARTCHATTAVESECSDVQRQQIRPTVNKAAA